MAACEKPKNVCPRCDHRGCERVYLPTAPKCSPFNHPYRCPSCGAVFRQCEMRNLTAPERAEAQERKRSKAREYKEVHADRLRRLGAEWSATHRERTRMNERERYGKSERVRDERKANARRWSEENPERRKEISRRYYERHRHEIAFRRKRKLLDKLREEGKQCGSTS